MMNMMNMMKKLIIVIFCGALSVASSLANTCDCQDLNSRVERLERAVFSGSGTVKTKSLNNQANTSTPTDSTSSGNSEPSISAADKEKMMQELEKLKGSQEANQKYLDQLMQEN